jgi:dehydrogenase/reductase SDR family protein 1
LGLGEAGATVYITGRTVNEGETVDGLGGTIYETAAGVEKLGGRRKQYVNGSGNQG